MAHVEHFEKSSVGALIRHYAREKDADGNLLVYRSLGREKAAHIDAERTSENYAIGKVHDEPWIEQRLKSVYQRKPNKGQRAIAMSDVVVTLPKNESQDDENVKAFFQAVYESLADQLGHRGVDGSYDNIVGAWVHRDEAQPHLHFAFLPISDRSKKEMRSKPEFREKLSIRPFFGVRGKHDYQTLHKTLARDLKRALGRNVDVLTGITEENGGNKTIAQLKAENKKLEQENTRLVNERQELIDKRAKNDADLDKASGERIKPLVGKSYIKQSEEHFAKMREYSLAGMEKNDELERLKKENDRLESENQSVRNERDALQHKLNYEQQRIREEAKAEVEEPLRKAETELESVKDEAEVYLAMPRWMQKPVDGNIKRFRADWQCWQERLGVACVKAQIVLHKTARETARMLHDALLLVGLETSEQKEWYCRECAKEYSQRGYNALDEKPKDWSLCYPASLKFQDNPLRNQYWFIPEQALNSVENVLKTPAPVPVASREQRR